MTDYLDDETITESLKNQVETINEIKPFTNYRFKECIEYFEDDEKIVSYLKMQQQNIEFWENEIIFSLQVFSQIWEIIINHEKKDKLLEKFKEKMKEAVCYPKTGFVKRLILVLEGYI